MTKRNNRRLSPSRVSTDARTSNHLIVESRPLDMFVVDEAGDVARQPVLTVSMDACSRTIVGSHLS